MKNRHYRSKKYRSKRHRKAIAMMSKERKRFSTLTDKWMRMKPGSAGDKDLQRLIDKQLDKVKRTEKIFRKAIGIR